MSRSGRYRYLKDIQKIIYKKKSITNRLNRYYISISVSDIDKADIILTEV
jgi:phage protein D